MVKLSLFQFRVTNSKLKNKKFHLRVTNSKLENVKLHLKLRGSEFSSYEIELRNLATQNNTTLRVTNSKIFIEILLSSY